MKGTYNIHRLNIHRKLEVWGLTVTFPVINIARSESTMDGVVLTSNLAKTSIWCFHFRIFAVTEGSDPSLFRSDLSIKSARHRSIFFSPENKTKFLRDFSFFLSFFLFDRRGNIAYLNHFSSGGNAWPGGTSDVTRTENIECLKTVGQPRELLVLGRVVVCHGERNPWRKLTMIYFVVDH